MCVVQSTLLLPIRSQSTSLLIDERVEEWRTIFIMQKRKRRKYHQLKGSKQLAVKVLFFAWLGAICWFGHFYNLKNLTEAAQLSIDIVARFGVRPFLTTQGLVCVALFGSIGFATCGYGIVATWSGTQLYGLLFGGGTPVKRRFANTKPARD